MAEPKKKSVPPPPLSKPLGGGANQSQVPLSDLLSQEEMESLSTLQLVDLIVSKLPPRHPTLMDFIYLRERISAMEETNFQAQAIIEKLRSPAFRVGTMLMPIEPDKAHVCVGGTDYVCRVDPQIPLSTLQIG